MIDKLYIIIPAYNEQENITQVIDDWYPIVKKNDGNGESKLIIIDDGSKDDTFNIMKQYAEDLPLFQPITKPNAGHGATILYGYNHAINQDADYIFQTDSDRQTLPSEFDQFWAVREQFDMVIGERNSRKDGISRIFVTKILRIVIKIFFGVDVKDANTPYRLMNRKALEKSIKLIPENYNLSNISLSVIYTKTKLLIKYIPITFRERQGGVNSINFKRIFTIGIQAISDFVKINKAINESICKEKN